jgi:hypothetical protein
VRSFTRKAMAPHFAADKPRFRYSSDGAYRWNMSLSRRPVPHRTAARLGKSKINRSHAEAGSKCPNSRGLPRSRVQAVEYVTELVTNYTRSTEETDVNRTSVASYQIPPNRFSEAIDQCESCDRVTQSGWLYFFVPVLCESAYVPPAVPIHSSRSQFLPTARPDPAARC